MRWEMRFKWSSCRKRVAMASATPTRDRHSPTVVCGCVGSSAEPCGMQHRVIGNIYSLLLILWTTFRIAASFSCRFFVALAAPSAVCSCAAAAAGARIVKLVHSFLHSFLHFVISRVAVKACCAHSDGSSVNGNWNCRVHQAHRRGITIHSLVHPI